MYLVQRLSDLRGDIPSQSRACNASCQGVESSFRVCLGNEEVLGNVLEQEMPGVDGPDVKGCVEDSIAERGRVRVKLELARISCADELDDHPHELSVSC